MELHDGDWLSEKFFFGGKVNVIGSNDFNLIKKVFLL